MPVRRTANNIARDTTTTTTTTTTTSMLEGKKSQSNAAVTSNNSNVFLRNSGPEQVTIKAKPAPFRPPSPQQQLHGNQTPEKESKNGSSSLSWNIDPNHSPNSVIGNDNIVHHHRSYVVGNNTKRRGNNNNNDNDIDDNGSGAGVTITTSVGGQHSVSSYLRRQQKSENDSLLRVQVESAASSSSSSGRQQQHRTTFYVPVSLMLQREMEMKDAAKKSNINNGRWSGSRLYTMWKQRQQEKRTTTTTTVNSTKSSSSRGAGNRGGGGDDDDDGADNEEEITLLLTPESSMEEFSTLQWKPWLTTCIRAYYNTGTIRIPDDCIGPDILLALEYFGILTTSPDAFVFDSYHAYDRIRVWSAYFTHRNTIADWIIRDYNNKRTRGVGSSTVERHGRIWVACIDPEETKSNQTYIQVQGERAGVLWDSGGGGGSGGSGEPSSSLDGDSHNSILSCRSVYELFCDNKDAESELTRQMPRMMRRDFCEHVMRSISQQQSQSYHSTSKKNPTTAASFEMERVKFTTSAGQCTTEMRPTLRLQPTRAASIHPTLDHQPQSSMIQPQEDTVKMSFSSVSKESSGSDLAKLIGLQANGSELFGSPSSQDLASISKFRLEGERIIPSFTSKDEASSIGDRFMFAPSSGSSYDLNTLNNNLSGTSGIGRLNRSLDNTRTPSMDPIERSYRRQSSEDVERIAYGVLRSNLRAGMKPSNEMETIEQRHPLRSSPVPDDKRSSPSSELNKSTITGRMKPFETDNAEDAEFMEEIDAIAPVKVVNTAFGDLGSVTSGITMPFGDGESTIGELPRLRPNTDTKAKTVVQPPNDSMVVMEGKEEEKSFDFNEIHTPIRPIVKNEGAAKIERKEKADKVMKRSQPLLVVEEEAEEVHAEARNGEKHSASSSHPMGCNDKIWEKSRSIACNDQNWERTRAMACDDQDWERTRSMACDYPSWEICLAKICDSFLPVAPEKDNRSASPVRSVTIPTCGSVAGGSTISGSLPSSKPAKRDRNPNKPRSRTADREGVYQPTDEEDGNTSLNCHSRESVIRGAKTVGTGFSKQLDEFMRLAMDAIEPAEGNADKNSPGRHQESTNRTRNKPLGPHQTQAETIPDRLPIPAKQNAYSSQAVPNSAKNAHRGKGQVKRGGGGAVSNPRNAARGDLQVKRRGGANGRSFGYGHPDLYEEDSNERDSRTTKTSESSSKSSTGERRAVSSNPPLDHGMPRREPRRVRSTQNFAIARKKHSAQSTRMPPRHPNYTVNTTSTPQHQLETSYDNPSSSVQAKDSIVNKHIQAAAREDGLTSVPSGGTNATVSANSSGSKGIAKLFNFRRKSNKGGVVRV